MTSRSSPVHSLTFLHVGCGTKRQAQTTVGFSAPQWRELRLDIDPATEPDIVGSMTEMTAVATGSMDAVYSSHNLEHLYYHEALVALREFHRVLKPGGFAVVTCPDLQAVCAMVSRDKLVETAYVSRAGPVAPFDMLYGHRSQMARGNLFMAHRSGFTRRVLCDLLVEAGFPSMVSRRRIGHYEVWALACKERTGEAALRALAQQHFPTQRRTAAPTT